MGIFDIFKRNIKDTKDNINKTNEMILKEELYKMDDEEFIKKIISTMENSIQNNEIDELLMEECVKLIKERNIENKVIVPLLELMERNPLTSFGRPGAIVHHLETLNDYKKYLVNSIKKYPTLHTVWMLNRCINACDEKEKEYLELMKEVSLIDGIDIAITDLAKEFLKYHEENKQ